MKDGKRGLPQKLIGLLVELFVLTGFLLLAVRKESWTGLLLALGVPACIWLLSNLLTRVFHIDSLLFSLTNFLCALGILVLYDTKPAIAYHQLAYYLVGLVGMVACIYLIRGLRNFRLAAPVMILLSLAALAFPLIRGREINGARNWIFIGPVSLQPSEFVKIALILSVSWYMSRRRMLPWLGFSVAALGLLMLQKDLGTALLYYATALLLYLASSGNRLVTCLGLAGGGGAAVLGYAMFAHVKKRVAIWINPFADYDHAGYQIVQGLMALASGSLIGVGLGKPDDHTGL